MLVHKIVLKEIAVANTFSVYRIFLVARVHGAITRRPKHKGGATDRVDFVFCIPLILGKLQTFDTVSCHLDNN